MIDVNERLKTKQQRIEKLFKGEKLDKVPFYLKTDGYLAYYAGYKQSDVDNFDLALEINKKALLELNPDAAQFYTAFSVWVKPLPEMLGGTIHNISDEGILQIIPSKLNILDPKEYDSLIEDPASYLLEKVIPRRYNVFSLKNQNEKYDRLLKAFSGLGNVGNLTANIEREAGTISFAQGVQMVGVDVIFDFYRDFTGIAYDLRRCPEKLRDAGLAITEQQLKTLRGIEPCPYQVIECPLHLPAFIKPKDFEKVYYPCLKRMVEGLHDMGFNLNLMFEKNYMHLHEYLKELPHSRIMGLFEEDDLKTVKKNLGDGMIIAGGLSQELLYFGTKQKCIDHTKWLIDEFGADGNFVIAPNIPLVQGIDAKPENIKAVADTIETYGTF